MAHPPDSKGEMQQEEGNELNRLGRQMRALNILLDTSMPTMALRVGVNKGTLSVATHGKNGTRKETILLLAEKYRLLAEAKGVVLPVAWELFFTISGFDSTGVIDGADQALIALEQRAAEKLKKEEVIKGNQDLRRENRKLRRENERLKGEVARLKGEEGNS